MTSAPPPDWDDLPPPNNDPDGDPFADFFGDDWADPTPAATEPDFNAADGWHWHDAALIGIERTTETGAPEYGIGAVDLYANVHTGETSGRYLEIGTFRDFDDAAALYRDLTQQVQTEQVLPFNLADMAARRTLNPWQEVTAAELGAYDELRALTEPEPSAPTLEPDAATAFRALNAIGLEADGFNPQTEPPPFIDPQTGTAYWIGVFQPDKDDRELCITSILSLGRNAETGEVEAQLAPCAVGDWDKAYRAAEHLLNAVDRGGIDAAFELAEGMALAADQRELWETARGIPLETHDAQHLAEYARTEWEIDL